MFDNRPTESVACNILGVIDGVIATVAIVATIGFPDLTTHSDTDCRRLVNRCFWLRVLN